MPKELPQVACLKIDFKYDDATSMLHIIDCGDGLSAGTHLMDKQQIHNQLLQSIFRATGAAIAPLVQELLETRFYDDCNDIPVIRRRRTTGQLIYGDDLTTNDKRFFLFSAQNR